MTAALITLGVICAVVVVLAIAITVGVMLSDGGWWR